MTQTEVNIIGAVILLALFYYVMIHKPRKLLKSPDDLQPVLKPVANLKLSEIAYKHFSNDYYNTTHQPFNLLLNSPKLNRNTVFNNEMKRLEADAVLIEKKSRMPVVALLISTKDDERKGSLISGIGVGCLIFSHVDDELEIVDAIKQYLSSNANNTEVIEPELSPV